VERAEPRSTADTGREDHGRSQVILVDDGSRDRTWELSGNTTKDPRVRGRETRRTVVIR
jgi:hypothetical protein